jgi:hypothetical protein
MSSRVAHPPIKFTHFVRNRTKCQAFAPEVVLGRRGSEWRSGSEGSVSDIDEDYNAASQLETRLLHCGALVVGPVSSFDEAFRCLVFEELDAAVLGAAPNLGTSVMISHILSRLGIPFVFISSEPIARVSDSYDNLVVGKPVKADTIARLLAQNAESTQDNIPNSTRHLSKGVRA